jgi:hypothetical protein
MKLGRSPMTAEELEAVFYREPFQPFRLLLTDGEEILCRKPRKSLVSGDQIAVVGICRRGSDATVERLRMISVERVKSAEFVPPSAFLS